MNLRTRTGLLSLGLGLLACGLLVASDAAPSARAEIAGVEGSALHGVVTFTQSGDGVEIVAELEGAAPGVHGFHLHEKGDCSAADFTSAGGHFNPAGVAHGAPDAEPHHAGDFGNITVGEDGRGRLELTSSDLTVAEGPTSVVGKAVIVHDKADDLTSQPTGAAGARIGCGVVK